VGALFVFTPPAMIRYILGFLISILAITFIKAVVTMIQRTMSEAVNESLGGKPSQQQQKAAPKQAMLRKCVSCGTYMPEQTMIRYGSGEKSVYFCSKDCEAKANA
jgi:hypothetical protein